MNPNRQNSLTLLKNVSEQPLSTNTVGNNKFSAAISVKSIAQISAESSNNLHPKTNSPNLNNSFQQINAADNLSPIHIIPFPFENNSNIQSSLGTSTETQILIPQATASTSSEMHFTPNDEMDMDDNDVNDDSDSEDSLDESSDSSASKLVTDEEMNAKINSFYNESK